MCAAMKFLQSLEKALPKVVVPRTHVSELNEGVVRSPGSQVICQESQGVYDIVVVDIITFRVSKYQNKKLIR